MRWNKWRSRPFPALIQCACQTCIIDTQYAHIIIGQLLCNNQSESSAFHRESAIKLFQCAWHNVKFDVLIQINLFWSKMRHIRCCCFYCSQCHLHKMGQTRSRDLSLCCLSFTQTTILKATGYRFPRLKLKTSSLHYTLFICFSKNGVEINYWSCAPLEHWSSFPKMIGQSNCSKFQLH